MLNEKEKEIVRQLQKGLPTVPRPFLHIAEQVGITEEELMDVVSSLMAGGYLRRICAVLRHQEAGYAANAMAVWNVPDELIERAGLFVAGFPGVTHCYQRVRRPGWPYNLYAMLHGRTEEECTSTAEKIARTLNLDDYLLLFSTAELKKTSMPYFED